MRRSGLRWSCADTALQSTITSSTQESRRHAPHNNKKVCLTAKHGPGSRYACDCSALLVALPYLTSTDSPAREILRCTNGPRSLHASAISCWPAHLGVSRDSARSQKTYDVVGGTLLPTSHEHPRRFTFWQPTQYPSETK